MSMTFPPVTVSDVLLSRDRRAAAQQAFLARYRLPLISFTMNIPGAVKRSGLSDFAFCACLHSLTAQLGQPVDQQVIFEPTGCEALLVYHRDAAELKALCLSLEEQHPVGRLYDLDVLNVNGEKLSRLHPRACLVCGGSVMNCSRSRAHGLDTVAAAAQRLLVNSAADQLSELAAAALVEEVTLTPKPGLVDQNNNGAHKDMDLPLFLRSAEALRPHFRTIFLAALNGGSPDTLQQLGLQAERAMFDTTDGVNTHKGVLYSLSLLLCGIGRSLSEGGAPCSHAAALCAALLPPTHTHGALMRERYGVAGVRGEALAGFPTVRRGASMLADKTPLTVLLWLMAHTEDSNLYYRGGREGALFVQSHAATILKAAPSEQTALALELDRQLIARHLSPGGCADLLALSLFLHSVQPLLPPYCSDTPI